MTKKKIRGLFVLSAQVSEYFVCPHPREEDVGVSGFISLFFWGGGGIHFSKSPVVEAIFRLLSSWEPARERPDRPAARHAQESRR